MKTRKGHIHSQTKTIQCYATMNRHCSLVSLWSLAAAVIIISIILQDKQHYHVASAKSSLSASPRPISVRHGLGKIFQKRLHRAHELAEREQQVENYNAELIASATTNVERFGHRRLIALPLDESFDPPVTDFSHGHIHTGDKISLPGCFFRAIKVASTDPPWLIRVKRIDGVTSEPRVDVPEQYSAEQLDEAVGTPLDFRSPSNFVFLPLWMMRALGLRPHDVVDVSLIAVTESVPPGSVAKFRPHSKEWTNQIAGIPNVLEMELRHYLSLTKGSTIAFDYNDKRYWFDVVELKSAPKDAKAKIVRTMDCNLRTEFTPAKDEKRSK
jgi:Ubiquitin fusion degradation protein UFD1